METGRPMRKSLFMRSLWANSMKKREKMPISIPRVIARPGDDHSDLFTDGGDAERTVPMLLCRSIDDDGRIVIGVVEPGNDLMLSELLLWETHDEV